MSKLLGPEVVYTFGAVGMVVTLKNEPCDHSKRPVTPNTFLPQ